MQNSGVGFDIKLKSGIALLQRVVIACASMAAIILGLYLAYSNDVGSAVTCLTTGIVLFIFSNLDLFESIKAPGVEATMRKFDAKVQEVRALANKVASTSSVRTRRLSHADVAQHLRERPASLAGPLSGPRGMVLGHEMTGDQTRANHAVAHLADGSIFFDRESS